MPILEFEEYALGITALPREKKLPAEQIMPDSCVQARIKGMTQKDTDPKPKIWIRPSQDKMAYSKSEPLDFSHHSPLRANHFIAAKILDDVLIEFLIKGLTDEVEPLMDWESPMAMVAWWYIQVINQIGGVASARTQRQASLLAFVSGI
ncbi:hypothetical protein L208DRAFT_1375365 [Tricholoma matsutake]|nr:hypothetical protein L208DRAFT_1375365 [Tricholoma matsutake 945]